MKKHDALNITVSSASSPPSGRGLTKNLDIQSAMHSKEIQSLSNSNDLLPHVKSPRIMTIYQLRQKRHMSEPFFKSPAFYYPITQSEHKPIKSTSSDCWVCKCEQLNSNFSSKCTNCGYRKSLLEHNANNILPPLSPTLSSSISSDTFKVKENNENLSIESTSNTIKTNEYNKSNDYSESDSTSDSDDILCELNDIGVEEFNKYRSKSLPAYSLEFPDRFIRTFGGIKKQEDKPIKLKISLQPPKAVEKHDSIVVGVFKENMSFYSKKSSMNDSIKSNINSFASITPPLLINSTHKSSVNMAKPLPPAPVFNESLSCPLKLKVNNVATL